MELTTDENTGVIVSLSFPFPSLNWHTKQNVRFRRGSAVSIGLFLNKIIETAKRKKNLSFITSTDPINTTVLGRVDYVSI